MNPADHIPGSMPARQTEIVPAPTGHEIDETYHDAPSTGKRITVKVVGRAVRRYWWQALVVWLVASVGLMAFAYLKVKPTYGVFARVRVEPAERAIFNQSDNNSEFGVYKETQVNTITSPVVLETALTKHPEIALLPHLSQADDKIAEMRAAINVMIVPKTNHIDISMSSETLKESTDVVNAVVEAYLLNASDNNSKETDQKIKRLSDAKQEKAREVEQKRAALKQLTNKLGAINVTEIKGRNTVSVEQYIQLSSQLLETQLELMKADARLAHLQNEQPAAPAAVATGDSGQITERQFSEMFYNHPQVVEIKAKFDRANERYHSLRNNVRDLSDPSLMAPLKTKRDAQVRLDALWTQLKPTIEAQIRSGDTRPGGPTGPDPMLREAEIEASSLRIQEASLTEKLGTLNIKQREEGNDAIALKFEEQDLNRAEKYLDTIEANLQQIEFENRNPLARIRMEFPAKAAGKASTSNRLKVMAIAPIGVLFGVLSLLVLLELHAGRVVDPDDVTARLRVPVIGVVPPLPQIRASGGVSTSRDEFRVQRQLDQYVQSLDHLRVALCSGRNAWGRERRCILITSAIASEGKTTLAAQLAERCINAGLHTLLIDGDLRNPTLSRMFDVPSRLGLINVLRGEALVADAISIVGGAGGFSFLPAGSPKVDPSRLLHGDRLGKLLTEARQNFDIVIVDAPPVLPVPDALTIGRWCDGAVLAVRYDMSRFPLVEKANRRLTTVGVSVIGAVVNGVRLADSAYGSYYPSYSYTHERSKNSPLDV